MTTAQDRLTLILPTWYELLTQWSLDGSLVSAATDALVLDGSNAKKDAKGQLQSYVSQWSAGNFQNLPKIVLLSAADISGAYGAYADSTDTIYLNQEWLLTANAEDIQNVLTEELGHYLDDQLNQYDLKGDEGEYFAQELFRSLSAENVINDHILIQDKTLGLISAEASFTSNISQAGYGDDSVTYDGGNDIYTGQTGYDTLYLNFSSDQVTIVNNNDLFYATTPNGILQFIDFEKVVFTDTHLDLSVPQRGLTAIDYIEPYISNLAFGGYEDNALIYVGGNDLYTGQSAYDILYLNFSSDQVTIVNNNDLFYATTPNGILRFIDFEKVVFTDTHLDLSVPQRSGITCIDNIEINLSNDAYGGYGDDAFVYNGGNEAVYAQGGYDILYLDFSSAQISVNSFFSGFRFGTPNGSLYGYGLEKVVLTDKVYDLTQHYAATFLRGNSLYATIEGPTWQESQYNSQKLGGNLVTINDLAENQFVFDNFVRGVPIWIGFTDQVQEGVWKWISGDTSTFTNWEPNRPDNYLDQDYASMGWSNGTEPRWEDARNGESVVTGVAEIPVTASITPPTTIKEASGVFTTTINISAGSLLSGNLLNGLPIYWEITGITQQDLDSLSPNGLTGTGVITNGQVQIQHSLVDDGVYEVESFQVRIFSDPNRQRQIGSTSSTAIVDKTIDTGDAIFRITGNGTGVETQSLTCILSQIDPDGMAKLPPSKTGDPTNGYAYQWQVSSDGISWTNAVGTGANTFKYSVNLTLDTNKFLRVQVGYTDDKGFTETIFTDSVRILSGSTKNDSLKGTAAVEVFFSGSGADAVATGAGNDFAKGGIGNDTFTGIDGDGDDFFDGQSEIDTISYSASSTGVDIDFVTGLATGRVDGGIGKDSFAGIENAQGTRGDDIFNGNLGLNRFTGVGGNDTFKFMNKQLGASACDHITDFSADTIALSKSAFGLPSTFTNTSSNFFASVSGTKAVNASAASIVYDIGSGYLYLNTDGAVSGQGTGGGVIAILDNKAALTSSNIVLL